MAISHREAGLSGLLEREGLPDIGAQAAVHVLCDDRLLHKMLTSMETTNLERCTLCHMCDDRVCTDCPIPADKPLKL